MLRDLCGQEKSIFSGSDLRVCGLASDLNARTKVSNESSHSLRVSVGDKARAEVHADPIDL